MRHLNAVPTITPRTDQWRTPLWLFAIYHARYRFTCDVCGTPENALVRRFLTDGLRQRWGRRNWCNPPYHRRQIHRWVHKAYWECVTHGRLTVMLLPLSISPGWYSDYCIRGEIEQIPFRLSFGDASNDAMFDSQVVIFDPETVIPDTGSVDQIRVRLFDPTRASRPRSPRAGSGDWNQVFRNGCDV
jgi:phage N-6-adenine-methyltransferase